MLANAKTAGRRGAPGPRPARSRGSAILADREPAAAPIHHPDYADFVRQRKDEIAREIREQRERSLRIADGIADIRIRRAFLKAEAQHERDIADFWRHFFRRMRKQPGGGAAQAGNHAAASNRAHSTGHRSPSRTSSAPPSGEIQLAAYSGPVLDRNGRRGVYLAASYLGAKHTEYGCARRLVRYVTDPEHVEWLGGIALCGSNIGDSRSEMSAAFGLVEDLNRAARANAKVVFHLIVQLPYDVTPAERAEIMRRWCEDQFGLRNLPHVWAVHTPDADGDQRNYHGHVAVSFRPLVRVAPFEWDAGRELKAELDNPEQFRVMREQFARVMTEVAQEAGKAREYTALSHAARGLKIKPTEHLGAHKTRLVREGDYVSTDARNRARIKRNEAMLEIERLKRRRTAMERRLARVRQVEARSIDPVHKARRPSRSVGIGVSGAIAAQRTRRARPAVIRPPAAHQGALVRLPMQKPALASRPANTIAPFVATPIVAARDVGGSIMRLPAMTAASRPAAKDAVPTWRVVPRVRLGPSAPPVAAATTPSARRPSQSPIHIATPSLSSRPHQVEVTAIGHLKPSARPQDAGMNAVSAARAVVHTATVLRVQAVAINAVSAACRAGHADGAIAEPLPVVSRTMGAAGPATREADISQADRLPPATSAVDIDLLQSAFGERAESRRAGAKAGAPQAILAAIARIEWDLASSHTDAALDQLETLDEIEPLTPASMTAITERVHAADFYIHDDGAGRLELDPRAMAALRVTEAQLAEEPEQAALAEIRRNQQRAFADLVVEAKRRPLAFGTTGSKPWPRDLDPPLLVRLDRWSHDEGFQGDLFFAVEQPVREAHERSHQTVKDGEVRTSNCNVAGTNLLKQPIPDGFGGWRDTAPPVFEAKPVGPRLHAFDKMTGKPSRSLLILLHFCGEYPQQIDIARDGRLVALPGTPKLIEPLVRMWRHHARVQALVVETISASRKAGRAVWPARYAAPIRAIVPGRPPPHAEPSKDPDIGR